MAQPLRTTLIDARVIPAAGETSKHDLPVNPLSALVFTLRPLNETAALGAFEGGPGEALGKFSDITVTYRGSSIIQGTPLDLILGAAHYTGRYIAQAQRLTTDNNIRAISFVLPFGRRLYNPLEAFPATRRGDLVLALTSGADPVGFDNYLLTVESIELLDATPEQFLRMTTTSRIMQAGDVNEIELPLGNKLIGALLRAASFPTGASMNSSFGILNLEADNVEIWYSGSHWESLHGETWSKWRMDWAEGSHFHVENTAGVYTQNAATLQSQLDTDDFQAYAMLDFDPMHDGSMGIDTSGMARLHLQVNSDVTDGTASRVLPIELVTVAGLQRAGQPAPVPV